MKTLTGVLVLMLALMFGASSVVVAAEKAATPEAERIHPVPPPPGAEKGGPPAAERMFPMPPSDVRPAVSPQAGQKDPCANVKNDPTKQADCQKAAKLGRAALSGGGSEAKVSVCSGGYWWTGGWGGWTQGGPCSPEGSIK